MIAGRAEAVRATYPVELVGARVRLREYAADDAAAIRPYAEDPEVHRYMVWQPDRPEDTVAWLKARDKAARAEPRTEYAMAITLRANGELVGGVDVSRDSEVEWGLGYVLRRDQWGAGLTTEAARLTIDFALGTLGAHRVRAMCDPRNAGSWRVMEKCGMRREGLIRKHLSIAGTWRDSYSYAILAEEWAVLRDFPSRARAQTGLPLTLARVNPSRIEEVHELMRLVGTDMLDRFGMDHWREPFDLEEMRADARRRETWVARDDTGALAAAFTIGHESLWLSENTLPWSPAVAPMWLNRMMVTPALQGRGIGALLMGAIEDLARARGCDAVRLETRTDFDEVQRFYKGLGYVERYSQPASQSWSAWNALNKAL